MWKVLGLLLLASCNQVFGVPGPESAAPDSVPPPVLVQQVVHDHIEVNRNAAVAYPIAIPQTTAGSTLVAIMGMRTATQKIDAVTDAAGNTWVQALLGPEAPDQTYSGRIAIWYAPNAMATSAITIAISSDRSTATIITEWGIGQSALLNTRASPYQVNASVQETGSIAVTGPALVIAGVLRGSGSISSSATDFLPLAPFDTPDVLGSAGYQFGAPGSYNGTWTFDQAVLSTGAIVAFER